MKYIKTNWDNPYYNMAFEKYIMENDKFDEDYLFFYIHKPSIIVGKHQNTIEEINKKFVDDNNIIVSRRNTGGGAVYHDEENLNFSFIFRKVKDSTIDFKKFTLPVINALKALGVDATLSGRNDILVNEKKVSGNAQCMNKTKVLHHGTLLFNVNIENLVNSLNVSQIKIESKAIKSVRSRVGNLGDYIDREMTILDFKDFLIEEFFKEIKMEEYTLTKEDIEAVNKLVEEKFGTWEHNYGLSPAFSIVKEKKFEAGVVKININVKEGLVKEIKINGDYFSIEETSALEDLLLGATYNKEDIQKRLENVDINKYIVNLQKDDFINLIVD